MSCHSTVGNNDGDGELLPTSDNESVEQKSVLRRESEGLVAFNKGFAECETTSNASNPVKKDTTTRGGKVNVSPMTPLKAIGGHSVQVLKLHDLRMFCSRNRIKDSRKAKKADICWAICKAKELYLAGQPPPYKYLMPPCDGPDVSEDNIIGGATVQLAIGEMAWGDDVVDFDERANKKRRVEDSTDLIVLGLHPPPSLDTTAYLGGLHKKKDGNELMILQRRLVRSKEETNLAIQLRETVESAAALRREIREEKDWRASLWKEIVQNVGNESLATTRAKAFRETMANDEHHVSDGSEIKGMYETLVENVLEQDELIRKMALQHVGLMKAIDQLIARENKFANDVVGVIC